VPFRPEDYDLFVFDCDGVILDSNPVKSRAFHEAALPFGEDHAQRLVDYHQQHGGISRQAKFAYFVAEILQAEPGERAALERDLVDAYARICEVELNRCSTIPGVIAFLTGLPAEVRNFVVSGGAQIEVRAALAERKLDGFFKEILGNPRSKSDNMQDLFDAGQLAGRGAYFGDARLDMELAERFGLDFVFVSGASEWARAETECRGLRFRDFEDILGMDR
jgi:phosphoglycolate phosphatase-like HAD superfamily hydrolase